MLFAAIIAPVFGISFPGPLVAGEPEVDVYLIKGFPISGDNQEYETAVTQIESEYPDLFALANFHIYDHTGNSGQIFEDVQNSTASRRAVVAYSQGTQVLRSLVEQGSQFHTIVTLDGYDMFSGGVSIDFDQYYDGNGFEDYRVVNLITDSFPIHGTEHNVDLEKSVQMVFSVAHGDLLEIATTDLNLVRWAGRFSINPSGGGGAPGGGGNGGGAASSSGAGVESKPIVEVQTRAFRRLSERRYFERRRLTDGCQRPIP